jgi:hypothetical protein
MGLFDKDMARQVIDIQQLLSKFGDEMTLRYFRHAERRDDTRDMLLDNRPGNVPAHVSRQGNVSMLKAEHHHGQTFILAIGCEPQPPPHINRIKDHKRDVVFVEFLSHDRASIAFACAALGENRKCFGRGVEWEL